MEMRRKVTVLLSVIYMLSTTMVPSVQFACANSTSIYRDFWLACPDIMHSDPPSGGAQIIIESEATTTVTVWDSFTSASLWSGTVSPGSPKVLNLPSSAEITENMVVENKGIHVTSDDADLRVQFRVPQLVDCSEDMYLAIPTGLLGRNYYAIAYEGKAGSEDMASQFVIVGTHDNTDVYIDGVFAATLGEGQTYQYQISGGDVTGTHITSDKPIAVIAGTETNDLPITVARTYYADNIFEQMIPVMYWGRDYYTAPLLSPMSGDRIRIVAADYYTRVRVNDGETTNVYYLPGDGGWIEIDVDPATHITSDLPIGVAQYAKGMSAAGEGDPFEMLIMPTSRFRKDYRFYIPDGYDTDDFDETQDPPVPGGGSYVTIIAPTVGTRVELDGDLIVAWTSLPDGGGYAKQIVYPGEHTITSDHPVGVYCHGYKFAGSYGYPAGFQVYLAYIWPATIRASPPTFNLFSPHSARWYTAYIELPEGVYVGDIDRTTILLNETIPVDPFWTEIQSVIGDYDNDTIPDLMVKFDRDAVANFILERVELKRAKSYWYAYVTLTVTGEVVGAPFEGSDTIKAVMPIRSG